MKNIANILSISRIFFLLFLAEIITIFVMFSKAFAMLRFKMIAIENEIDCKRELAVQAE